MRRYSLLSARQGALEEVDTKRRVSHPESLRLREAIGDGMRPLRFRSDSNRPLPSVMLVRDDLVDNVSDTASETEPALELGKCDLDVGVVELNSLKEPKFRHAEAHTLASDHLSRVQQSKKRLRSIVIRKGSWEGAKEDTERAPQDTRRWAGSSQSFLGMHHATAG